MEQGKKYRIISKTVNGLWNKPREMVYRFVAEEGDEYVFDARPLAGTQEMPRDWIARVYEVHEDVEIMLPRIHRGETRVL